MNTIETIKNKIEKNKNDLQIIFIEKLTELLKKCSIQFPEFKNIKIHINNHEFNDGDPTYFSLYYTDLIIIMEDTLGNETEFEKYNIEDKKELQILRKEFVDFFQQFDFDNFYEILFEKFDENIYFSLENGKLKYE